jgi:UDP-N-acetylglucosamine--N-acetylmuramyl-(pentapeptide) pyrophosphoryl-undecaprenol N-acetylglucosamine transferase
MAVSDTAGHVLPALAVGDAYRRLVGEVEVLFLGPAEGPAARLAERAGYCLEILPGFPLARASPVGKLAAVGGAAAAMRRARGLLGARRARLVIGFGGWATGGALVAARALGLGTAIVEPNVVPGLANRLLGPFVDRVYVSWTETRRRFHTGRALVTGTPVRVDLAAHAVVTQVPPAGGRARRILVMSGSRGEAFLARHVPGLLEEVRARGISLDVWHQAGVEDREALGNAYRRAEVPARVTPFIDDMVEAYGWADFVIARAGASTLAELAVAGLPSLLVPLTDAAGDHQSANAEAFAGAGAAWRVRETDWDARTLGPRLAQLLADDHQWSALSAAARRLAAPDAADRIVSDCEVMMRGRW